MSPQKRPSPERQNMLYSSHLHGMERPVRSFKSFIRITPPHTSPNKPLPPIPKLQKTSSSSSVTTVHSQSRSTGFSLWESPSNWDNGEGSQAQSTPSFARREYSPLIPEPPEDIAAMQSDPILWQLGNGPFPQTQLHPINEHTAIPPEIPPRNPSRLSLSSPNPVLARKNSRDSLSSVSSRYSIVTHDEELSEDVSESTSRGQANDDFSSPLDLASALSDETMNEKAFPVFGLGSPRDQGIVWGGQPQSSDFLQLEDDAHLDLHGNKLTTFRKGSVLVDNSPISPEGPELNEKIQALSFAQDYHNVLVGRYYDDCAQLEEEFPSRTPPKDQNLSPRPLAWSKESNGSPADAPQRPQMASSSFPGRHNNLRKMSSWVNQQLRKDSQTGLHQKFTGISDAPSKTIPESDVDRTLKRDARLADIIQHGKDLVSRKMLRRGSGIKKPLVISHPIQSSSVSPLSEPPFQLATPLFRLPGGLALVRRSPCSTPRPQTADASPTSPLSGSSWPDFPASSPFRFDFSRRSSWQSSNSQPQSQGPSAVGVKSRLGEPIGLPSSLRSFSHSSASLATPAPQEPSSPYSPPPSRRRSHNVGSPLTSPPTSHSSEQRGNDIVDDAPHKLNLFEKAKHARDAWRMHHREVKNEKFKQSIRLVGPGDARDVAGYIKCDGRASGDSGIGEGQLPGHMIKELS